MSDLPNVDRSFVLCCHLCGTKGSLILKKSTENKKQRKSSRTLVIMSRGLPHAFRMPCVVPWLRLPLAVVPPCAPVMRLALRTTSTTTAPSQPPASQSTHPTTAEQAAPVVPDAEEEQLFAFVAP